MEVKLSSAILGLTPTQLVTELTLTSKWCYEVTSDEPESVRKSRKRILFDIQLWNRGSLIPINDFSSP